MSAAVFAILMPVVIVVGFIVDARTNVLPGEQVIYAESWSARRSDDCTCRSPRLKPSVIGCFVA